MGANVPPEEVVDELLEEVAEVRLQEFVQLVAVLTKTARQQVSGTLMLLKRLLKVNFFPKGRVEWDDEIKTLVEESTSEEDEDGEDSSAAEDEDASKKGVAGSGNNNNNNNNASIARKSSAANEEFVAQSPTLKRVKGRLHVQSLRKEGLLQYVNFITKKDVADWFKSTGPSADGAISPSSARAFLEILAGKRERERKRVSRRV